MCPPPFVLFPFPTDAKDSAARQRWANKLKRSMQQSNKPWIPYEFSRVCSDHFIDGAPTDDLPDPELILGYDTKVLKRRKAPAVRKSQPQI